MKQNNQSLDTYLARLDPILLDPEYVFVTTPVPLEGQLAIAMIREGEQFSYVVERATAARAGLTGDFRCRRIDLGVDTALEMTGFLAQITAELALHEIPANAIAGYSRDHLFVPVERADDARKVLSGVAERARLRLARALDCTSPLEIRTDIWTVDGPIVPFFGMPYPTRMTLIRLQDGALFVHSPIALDESLTAAVQGLGEPRYLIAPNKLHHLFVAQWARRFPDAQIFGARGVAGKLPELPLQPLDGGEPMTWSDEIDQLTFRGSLLMEEVVFLHRSSRTLVVADLIENFDPLTLAAPHRLLARAAGILAPRGSMPCDWRLSFIGRGRRTAQHCADQILAWQPDAIVLSHGRVVTAGALPFLRHALRHFTLP